MILLRRYGDDLWKFTSGHLTFEVLADVEIRKE